MAVKKIAKKKVKKKAIPIPTNYEIGYINSVEDYIKAIKTFKGTTRKVLWFRGHCSNRYKLEPSIYRKPFSAAKEEFFIDRFKARAIPYLGQIPFANELNANAYFEWLFLMQHHKIPTRLLDWTTGALNALAFATIFRDHQRKGIRNNGAHVWCIDPIKLNSYFTNIHEIPNINENAEAQNSFGIPTATSKIYDKPLAIYGPQNSKRIVGQKGVFTIFPANNTFIFDNTISKDIGLKLIIKDDETVKNIISELYLLGITESNIYPELDSVSSEIINEFINMYPEKKK